MKKLFTIILGILVLEAHAQEHSHQMMMPAKNAATKNSGKSIVYDLYIRDSVVNYTGKRVHAIAINGQIPGPTLRFTEGDTAVIHVHNEMQHETSVHWHGLLLPNVYDGVPYLTTAPIAPGKVHTFVFPLIQSGTYWYHSHTMLQEQSGLYGSIVIQPKTKKYRVNDEVVLLMSDWTDENPRSVLKTLKRNDNGNEWFAIQKGYPQSLNYLLKHKAWGERLKFAAQRMPPMDISDVYYNRFLFNGKSELDLSKYKPGEKIRLRVINGSSSSYFYLQFAGGKMELIAADGKDVAPVKIDRILIGVAETYDFIITVPDNGSYELRATSQDVTGHASAFIGAGKKIPAADIPKPNVWKMSEMMGVLGENFPDRMQMDGMNMKGMNMENMPMNHQEKKDEKKDTSMKMPGMNMHNMPMKHEMRKNDKKAEDTQMDSMNMEHMNMADMKSMDMQDDNMKGMNMQKDESGKTVIFNYDMLRSTERTAFSSNRPIRKIRLDLTGNMYRYVWSFNNKALSDADKIAIRKGEVVQFELVNKTMMNHPMHLHGHFFRVLNKNGEYSPLKHTVDVPPMTTVTIEFAANEDKDWFFHCHILYHMASGMARIVHYEGSERDTSLTNYPLKKLLNEDKMWFLWGSIALKSQMTELKANYINFKNAFRTETNLNYGGQYEANLSYERYIGDWFRPYIGVTTIRQKYFNVFTGKQIFDQEFNLPVVGIRYTLPFFIEADLRVNMQGRIRFGIEGEEWLLPRLFLNWRINTDKEYHLDLEYILRKHIALSGGYDSRYKLGGGLLIRF